MARIKLPFVHEFIDRHGKVRRYLRRPGIKRVPLPGAPGSEEFMAAYAAAMAGAERRDIGADRTKPGTISALVVKFYGSPEFKGLAASTKATYRGIIERFREDHGEKRVAMMTRDHVRKMVAAKADTPSAANNFLRILHLLMMFAVDEGMRSDDPTWGVKKIKARSEGFATWSEADIEKFEAAHPVGSRARLALALLLYTGQRRSDVVRIGRQHVRQGTISIRQQKTGTLVEVPVHQQLGAIISASPADNMTFLVTGQGKPFTPAGFGNWFAEVVAEAGLPAGLSAHGLRKAACRRLAEAGCSPHQIMSISGHRSLKEVTR